MLYGSWSFLCYCYERDLSHFNFFPLVEICSRWIEFILKIKLQTSHLSVKSTRDCKKVTAEALKVIKYLMFKTFGFNLKLQEVKMSVYFHTITVNYNNFAWEREPQTIVRIYRFLALSEVSIFLKADWWTITSGSAATLISVSSILETKTMSIWRQLFLKTQVFPVHFSHSYTYKLHFR